MPKTIVGLFDNKSEAQRVVQDITQMGIPKSETTILENPTLTSTGTTSQSQEEPGFWESFKQAFGFGVPEHEGAYYAEGVRRGGTLVSVKADDRLADRVIDVMADHGAVDIDQRATEWRQSGWQAPAGTAAAGATGAEAVVPVVEEELQVGKREVQRGGVRVYSHVTEKPVEETVRLRDEEVRVERRRADRPVDPNYAATFKDDMIEMTETDEEAVVSKRARVIEEVVLRKDVKERAETVRDTVRRTDVEVQPMESGSSRTTAGATAGSTPMPTPTPDDADYRTHYDATFGARGYTYDQYRHAYRFGTDLAGDTQFAPNDWTTVEPEARRYWEERNEGTWEDFKDAVRYAWEKAKQTVSGSTSGSSTARRAS